MSNLVEGKAAEVSVVSHTAMGLEQSSKCSLEGLCTMMLQSVERLQWASEEAIIIIIIIDSQASVQMRTLIAKLLSLKLINQLLQKRTPFWLSCNE